MWIFLTARARQWLILVIALPAAYAGVRVLRTQVEKRRGPTVLSRILLRVEGLLASITGRSQKRSH